MTIETGLPGSAAGRRPHFERMHAERADPWRVTTRWYEERKRAVTLSILPDERYGAVLEIGCSIGVLTEALAARSDSVLAVDLADGAVARARERLDALDHVSVSQHDVTEGLPAGAWDLVVISEVGYYLSSIEFATLLGRIESALAPGGTLVACHWRYPEEDFAQTGDAVHRILAFETSLSRIAHHEEADFVLDVLSSDDRSVAQRTGLR